MSDRESLPSPAEIDRSELPEAVAEVVDLYETEVGQRPPYLWKWLSRTLPRHRLSTVPDRHHDTVHRDKLLLTVYYTTLDDLADLHQDRQTFMATRAVAQPGVDPRYPEGVDESYLAVAEQAWDAVTDTLADAPRREAFADLFRFDLEQFVTATHYGLVVSDTPRAATEAGVTAYAEHNMALFSYADVDLLFSPGVPRADLRPLREVVWDAQRLARLANCVATWEREVAEGDPTAGVLIRALSEGVVDPEAVTDPEVPDEGIVRRVRESGIEEAFLEEWNERYDRLRREGRCRRVDLEGYVCGMADVRELYLDSRGRV